MDTAVNDSDKWGAFLQSWWRTLEGRVVTSQELHVALPPDSHSAPSPHALSLIVASLRDREVNGYVVRKDSSAKGLAHWKLEQASCLPVAAETSMSAPSLVTTVRQPRAAPAKKRPARRTSKSKLNAALPLEPTRADDPQALCGFQQLPGMAASPSPGDITGQVQSEDELSVEDRLFLSYLCELETSHSPLDKDEILLAQYLSEMESQLLIDQGPEPSGWVRDVGGEPS